GRGHAFFVEPASIDCIGGAPSDSRSVRAARIRFGGRPNKLWAQRKKRLSVRRHLCEPTSEGRQTFRTTHPVADEIRARHQPQDSEGARFECSQFHAIARRRGDRITTFFTAPQNVCFWHKADIARLSSDVRYWG